MAHAFTRRRRVVVLAVVHLPVDAFIDPEGYRAFVDAAEAELHQRRVQ